MVFDRAVQELNAGLERLRSQVSDHLLWVVLQSKPEEPQPPQAPLAAGATPAGSADHYLVGRLEDRATEALDRVEEACLLSSAGLAPEQNLAATAAGLVALQEGLFNLLLFSSAELFGHDRVDELRGFGREHGDAWENWVENVIVEIDRCQEALLAACQSLLPCWQELAERVGTSSLLIQATPPATAATKQDKR